MRALGLRCVNCRQAYDLGLRYRCERCDFPLDVDYAPPVPGDAFEAAGGPGIWRFEPCLPPVDESSKVSLGEGNTPLVPVGRLGRALGLRNLYVKNEGLNPSGSFKDRPNCIGVSVALSMKVPAVVISSSGNAGASLAAYAARAGLKAVVLVTDKTPPAKLAQMLMHGARAVVVRGSVSDAYWLAYKAAIQWGWMNLTSTFLCPYTTEANKTVAYELFNQLGKVPEYIVVPVSVGALLVGIYKGFVELRALGLVDRLPRMVAAQADAYAPIARAFAEQTVDVRPWEANAPTVAGGIADPLAGYEKDGTYTLRTIRQSGGWAIACSDEEILRAAQMLARDEGILSEPTGAVGIASIRQLLRQADVSSDDTIVCMVTGHGLKQVHEVDYGSLLPEAIQPTLDALGAVLERAPTDALEASAWRGRDRRGVD